MREYRFLFRKFATLSRAKSVLLVYDSEPKVFKLHTFLNERVRADENRELAFGDPF